MAEKNAHEDQDTLQFRVPKQPETDYNHTRIYRKSDIEQHRSSNKSSSSPSGTLNNQQYRKKQTSSAVHNQNAAKQQPRTRQQRTAVPPETVPQTNRNPKAKPEKKKKGGFLKKLLLLVFAIFLIYSTAALYYITRINPIEDSGQYVNDPETMLYSSEVKNILVIGEDSRDNASRGLSDSIILLSVNRKNKKLQMTSFMRDIYTEIDGYDFDKINAAYSYGGAPLLKDTIEDNFKIRIDGCVTLNFTAVAHIVDAVGGVQITLTPEEANAVNEILFSEVNEIMGDSPGDDFLPGGGTYILDGKQALSYSRIRYIGNADFERTQRQRTVITQVLSRMKKINPVKFNSNITKALEYIGTDMSVTDMYIMSLRLPLLLMSYETEQLRVPADGTWSYGETWDGMSIINVDFYANTEYLKQNIYLQ